ncbi:MAG TPA: HEAT repeat domain-containing protein [Methylomirabilota bacterium]
MTSQEVAGRVKQKDWRVLDAAPGPDAGSAMLPLLDDPDPEVRELALHVLNVVGGPVARQGFLKALKDRGDTVRSAACRFLHVHATREDVPAILAEVTGSFDEYVREQMGLLVGKLGDANAIPTLERQLAAEPDAHARHGLSIALARLGERRARQAYLERLRADNPRQRAAALEDLLYIGDRRLVLDVLPLLDDLREAVNVAPSATRYFIRVCDVAVNVLDVLLQHPFSFKVERVRRYSAEELAEAKAVAARTR